MNEASVSNEGVSALELYGESYYATHCGHISYDRSQPHWAEFFGKIADDLIRTFRPRRIFDAGCALGFLVEALWDRGVTAYGRDISEYAISNTRLDIRQYCSVGSLAEPIEGPFDLITCIEVLEHMTEEEGKTAIANMTAAADRIVFSSSPTDLVEPTHINVKPPIYWIEAFAAHDFAPLIETTLFSITPYAVAFERRKVKPSDDYLHACAEIVRDRMKRADNARIIHELSVAINTQGSALAERTDERDGMAAERDTAAAERERLATERNQAFDDLASAAKRSVAMQASLHELTDANTHLYGLINQISSSRSWRLVRELDRIMHRLRLPSSRSHWAADLLAQAKASVRSFDREFYLKEYPDVAEAGVDPLQHYLHYGRAEGRVPSQIALERLVYETTHTGSRHDALHLIDLCDPQHEETGPKLGDEAFLVTVLTPAFNTDPRYIRELYQTLVNQSYSNWEWVVVDDGSSSTTSIAIMRDIARRDQRVRFFANPVNLGISGASNIGLAAAQGTHVALVDHDDLLSRHALLAVYEAWRKAPSTQLFYTDECKLQSDGGLSDIWAKPDWSPAYLEYTMCLGHLSVYSRAFLNELGGFRSEFDGTQDFDLALRASLRGPAVAHVPIFGYIWRIIPGSAAAGIYEKPYAIERQGRAVLDYARQRHAEAMVAPAHAAGFWRIRYPLAPSPPLLSYIIPAGGGVRAIRGKPTDLVLNCVRSFESKAFYPNREYVVVHDGLTAAQTQALAAIPGVRLVAHADKTFNFSRTVNAGVAAAGGEYICLLNDDIEAITERGGEELVGYLTVNPSVGAMGPKCLFEDGRIQQCGVVLLEATGPTHAGTGAQRDFGGHHLSLMCRRETYCIGAAVLVMRKAIYEELCGFREDMPLNYNDVDFSLRLRDLGYTCVVDPAVEVYHFESATKMGTAMVEQERMFLTRADTRDPYFSKWFDPRNPWFQLDLTAPDRLRPFGPWLDRHVARRAAALDQAASAKLTLCILATDQPLNFLDEALRSATMQTYANVQLLVVDCGIRDPEIRRWFETLEPRRGISTTSTMTVPTLGALGEALRKRIDAEFLAFLHASDFISVDAVQLLAANIADHPSAPVFYTDHYEADEHSVRQHPFFKPDFDPILLSNLWYPDCLLAAKSELLWKACEAAPEEPLSGVGHRILVQCLLDGETPLHIREPAYGRRRAEHTGKSPLGSGSDHQRAVARLIEMGGAHDLLAVEPQSNGVGPRLRLSARSPIGGVKILECRAVWGEGGCGVPGLGAAAQEPGFEWIAILLEPDNQNALRHLSAPALFDRRVNAVCGVLLDEEGLVQWSGGLFLPGGRLFDPYAGLPIARGGYHEMLSCQRCIDVAAAVNVLIRTDTILRVVKRFGVIDADGLMVTIGLDAAERGELVSVTPQLTAVTDRTMAPPADRRGVVLNHPSLQKGSRWYDGRLEVDRPFMMPGFG